MRYEYTENEYMKVNFEFQQNKNVKGEGTKS